MYNVESLKDELIEILEGLDKESMDLCSLKEYADIVKAVSEIKGKDYTEILASMIAVPGGAFNTGDSRMRAIGPRTIRELKEGKRTREEDDDE